MKTKRLLTTLSLLFAVLFTTVYAQTKTKTITIVQKGDSMNVTIDSLQTITENVITLVLNNENLDSIINSQVEDVNKIVKVMTVMSDTLQNSAKAYTYAFSSDGAVFDNISEVSEINELEDVDMNMVVHVDTLEDGKIIKKVTIISSGITPEAEHAGKRILVMSSGDGTEVVHPGKHVMIMSEGNDKEEFVWNAKTPPTPKELLNPVAISDLHLLKKAGFSANELTSKPIEFKSLNVNVEREKTSESDIINLSLSITLPEKDKATVTLIDRNGAKKEEKSYKDSAKIKVKFSMDKESAPYYIVVLQDKKVWTRKVEF